MNGVTSEKNEQTNGVQKTLPRLQIIDEEQKFTYVYYIFIKVVGRSALLFYISN